MAQSLPPEGLSWLLGAIFPTEGSNSIPLRNVEQTRSADENGAEEPELPAASREPDRPANAFRELEPFQMLIRPDLERNVRRRLKGLHLFVSTVIDNWRNAFNGTFMLNDNTDDHDQRHTRSRSVLAWRTYPSCWWPSSNASFFSH
jgi:hypothetical protein